MIEIVQESVDECKEMLNDRWNGIEGIPQIQKSHYFECINKYALQYSAHSESDLMSTHTFKLVETLVPAQKEYNLPDNVNIYVKSLIMLSFLTKHIILAGWLIFHGLEILEKSHLNFFTVVESILITGQKEMT